MTRDEIIACYVRAYRSGRWDVPVPVSMTAEERYGVRNAAHRIVCRPDHIEAVVMSRRLRQKGLI